MAAPPPQKPFAGPPAAQDSSGRQRSAGDELQDECAALEEEVEELRVKYEMYFLGVELREPNKWREEVKKKVLRIKEKFTRNTGLRFRIQSLHARFLSYERLWLRSAREREEGTYRRDLFKAKRHARGAPAAAGAKKPAAAKPDTHDHHLAEDVDLSDFGGDDELPAAPEPTPAPIAAKPAAPAPLGGPPPGLFPRPGAKPAAPAPVRPAPAPAPSSPRPAQRGEGQGEGPGARPAAAAPVAPAPVRPTAAPARPPAAAPAPAPSAAARLADGQMRELYDAYISAKKRCNEDTTRLTFEAVSASVSKQIPEIMKQHHARSVEFKVVIKDGKAKLTAVPKT